MSKMIPSVISPEIKSMAEKRIFEWFQNAPGTEDWIVIHSLGISTHNKLIHGETDFFVLIPYKGIFALEVKGGRVTRKDGIWSFKDRYDNVTSKPRGPFDQAWDGVNSIVDSIKRKLDLEHKHIEKIFYGIGVMFPDIEYKTIGCDEEQWQVFDCNDGNNVYDYMNRIFEGAKEKWEKTYGKLYPEKLPSEEDVQYIASLLRGDFDIAVSLRVHIHNAEEELIKLTKEQYRCIDQLDDNKRCLIEGGAGTGKTLLAIEEAKKSVAKGLRVALFCYNRNLGAWLTTYFENTASNLQPAYVGTLHSYMIKTIKNAGEKIIYPCTEDEDYFYSDKLPVDAVYAMTQLRDYKYDMIILDEAQDLITKRFLDVINASLKGGLERGRWTFFGDFSQQAIYSVGLSGRAMKDMIEERSSYSHFKLTKNCRNTKTICEEISIVTGFEAPDVWSNVDGVPVQYYSYSDPEEEKDRLLSILNELRDSHISSKQICILSPIKRENSIVSEITEFEISDYKVNWNKNISFCTIQSFKGLENSIVILTDIDSLNDQKLLYVALSRARTGLYVLLSEKARGEYLDIQKRRLLNG